MRCEVCGRRIDGKPFNVIIEGAKLTVCDECSRLGKTYREEPRKKTTSPPSRTMPKPLMMQTRRPQTPRVDTSLELVEGFELKIRQAREKLGLSHEELGKSINEKVSLLRKIETGKMTPDNKVAAMLEHALKIKLIVPAKEEKVPQNRLAKVARQDLTLGDLIQLEKKGDKKEDTTGRGQS